MRRIAKLAAAGLVVVVAVGFFFLAPMSFWYYQGGGPVGAEFHIPVYRSLGCATVGMGDLYSPGWFGFSFGCSIPVPVPF
jgi:tetrahydromethanopterin S-methyltransferase subunit D